MKELVSFIACGTLGFTIGGFLYGSLGPFGSLIGLIVFIGGHMLITKESPAEYRERVEESRIGRIPEHPNDR
jgi:hypothetical protein